MKAIVAFVGFVALMLGMAVSLKTLGWWPGESASPSGNQQSPVAAAAEITISRATAPIGATITVYGSGFQAGEQVELRVHVTTVGSATADGRGKFTQNVTIPPSAPPAGFPTNVIANGHSSGRWATAPFSTS